MVHEVLQGEGGEQGDALMPALFSLGQHDALVAIQGRLAPDERLMAFLDDIYAVGDRPRHTAAAYTAIQEELRTHTGIEVHQGKTQLWNRAGNTPVGCAALTATARVADLSAIVWRGDLHLPLQEKGVKIFGTPLGHPRYVSSQLAALTAKHEQLVGKILQVEDLQYAWILLLYCASARANCTLRVVHPKLTDALAAQYDASMCRPLSLEMTAARNPSLADLILTKMGQAEAGFHVAGASQAREQLVRAGFNAPHWGDLAGLRPPGEWTNDMWASQVMGGNMRQLKRCTRNLFSTTLSVRASIDQVTRWPRVRGPVHVLPMLILRRF